MIGGFGKEENKRVPGGLTAVAGGASVVGLAERVHSRRRKKMERTLIVKYEGKTYRLPVESKEEIDDIESMSGLTAQIIGARTDIEDDDWDSFQKACGV